MSVTLPCEHGREDHPDHLNTPRLVADATGTAVWRWDQQEPFGNDTPNGDPGNTGATFDLPLRLPGQYADKETNLNYNYFRSYDSAIGRYVQSDPIGLSGGLNSYSYVDSVGKLPHLNLNPYAYASSNPLSRVDPKGLLDFDSNRFASQIEEGRFDLLGILGTLVAAEAVGTMPKTTPELRGLGVPKAELNPYTSQLSRWSGRVSNRALREVGRKGALVCVGGAATGLLVFEGFYDWGIIGKAAWDATSF
jgi:RHS repeat-associated protein